MFEPSHYSTTELFTLVDLLGHNIQQRHFWQKQIQNNENKLKQQLLS